MGDTVKQIYKTTSDQWAQPPESVTLHRNFLPAQKQTAAAYLGQLRRSGNVLTPADAGLADHGELGKTPLLQGTVHGGGRVTRDEALEIKHLAPVYWPFAFQYSFADVV